MTTEYKTAAEVAGAIVDDPEVQKRIEIENKRSKIVNILISIRLDKGVSQKELAKKMNCNQSKISRMESGTDVGLHWVDIAKYLSSLEIDLSILFMDRTIPITAQMKQMMLVTSNFLDRLVMLAKKTPNDHGIIKSINEFLGTLFRDYARNFQEASDKLSKLNVIEFKQEDDMRTEETINDNVKQKTSAIS